jgi:hypothetical protein
MAFIMGLRHVKAQKMAVKDIIHTVDCIQIWYLKWKDKEAMEFSKGY